MASSAEDLRRRIVSGLETRTDAADARAVLLEHVVGALSEDFERILATASVPAAVLVGLIPRPEGVHVLLTERAAHLARHPGQISFPGGRLEAGESPVAGALREAAEEVALAPEAVDVLGSLRPRLTGTGFSVTPVVGWLRQPFVPRPDPAEVESVFEVPIEHLLAPATCRQSTRERYGTQFIVLEYQYERYRIWGATAAILAEMLEMF